MEKATAQYIEQRAAINEQYAEAWNYEWSNFHVDKGAPGGEGKMYWSNKQQIVDRWSKPMREQKVADARWKAVIQKNMAEKEAIAKAAQAEAKKEWPAKFEAVQKAWTRLSDDFDTPAPKSLASKAEIKSSLTKAWKAGWAMD